MENPSDKQAHNNSDKSEAKSLWILSFYIILLIVPWLVDSVFTYRFFYTAAYNQRNGLPQSVSALNPDGWIRASTVLNKIQALLAIPVVSGLLAQAAVVYSQQRFPDQKLSMRQLLALADRSWADVPGFWRALDGGVGSRLVWLGGLLILIILVLPPLQSLLAGTETPQVNTCHDGFYGCHNWYHAGLDPEPRAIQYLPSIIPVQRVSGKIISVNQYNKQPHLWPEQWERSRYEGSDTLSGYFDNDGTYYVSSLPRGTNTGVLRQLSIRMSSTTECANVSLVEFPATCSGKRPFTSNFSLNGQEVRICAPGAYDETPWTLSRDRQDITEELWIDMVVPNYTAPNFTLHCTTNTTRGYFEIPNVHTNNKPGPLLESWPSVEEMEKDWNDVIGMNGANVAPTVMDNFTENGHGVYLWEPPVSTFQGPYDDTPIAPGPLMISTLAMFGNNSWWYAARENSNMETITRAIHSICQSGNIPFTAFTETNGFPVAAEKCIDITWAWLHGNESEGYIEKNYQKDIYRIVGNWVGSFSELEVATDVLQTATYFANEAVLTAIADLTYYGSKSIYASEGSYIIRPYKHLSGLVVITVLVCLQLAALMYVAWYVHSMPVWTDKLDAFAMRNGAYGTGIIITEQVES
ncbi:hypothetical protein VP1G_06892 [Cytospora mali]|uniref:Uncharacterized protein n=1 Tax=Cytospora mali TaxID=578113 RepID=A0A194V6X1_CYTMA|nr:hypothetical protein VP1G_06892 [Valsa mali var. pyri (nom. inval.)]